MDLSDIAHHALWGLAGLGAWKQMKRSPAVASGLVFEMIRMMAIQDCHSTHFDALYRHSKWWLARASRHVCLAFLFGLTKATGGIWQIAWSGQMDFPTSKWISLKYMYVLYVSVYIYIYVYVLIFFSPNHFGWTCSPKLQRITDRVSTKGQAAASGAFVQLGGCLCK